MRLETVPFLLVVVTLVIKLGVRVSVLRDVPSILGASLDFWLIVAFTLACVCTLCCCMPPSDAPIGVQETRPSMSRQFDTIVARARGKLD
jgi:hypothetical protein